MKNKKMRLAVKQVFFVHSSYKPEQAFKLGLMCIIIPASSLVIFVIKFNMLSFLFIFENYYYI